MDKSGDPPVMLIFKTYKSSSAFTQPRDVSIPFNWLRLVREKITLRYNTVFVTPNNGVSCLIFLKMYFTLVQRASLFVTIISLMVPSLDELISDTVKYPMTQTIQKYILHKWGKIT